MDAKLRCQTLVNKYEWDKNEALKIWCFGPDTSGPNMLCDSTKATQYLSEIRDSMESSFQWATKEAVLAEENMRGVRFNIMDISLHTDAVHRGGGQICPTARRVYNAAQYTAKPRFQEPIFLVEIQFPDEAMGGIYQCLSARRGNVIGEEPIIGTPLRVIKAYLPVAESFGFTQHLREMTSGKAFPSCIFDHWETVTSDPFEAGTKAHQMVINIRKRKGLKVIQPLDSYLDKL